MNKPTQLRFAALEQMQHISVRVSAHPAVARVNSHLFSPPKPKPRIIA